jgi:peptide/nickel transport system substrate-binding protein
MRMKRWFRPLVAALVLSLLASPAPGAAAAPEDQMSWAVHVSIAPAWFDPGEHSGIITSMMIFYALHDALVKPMPGNAFAPSLAQSWNVSPNGLIYEFVLRSGVMFHNGEVMTAEDVKFSFERYKGAAAKLLKEKVAAVEVVDPLRVRFRLKEPWPDFMAFYATPATGAGWIVSKDYIEKVGEGGFKKAPIGAGPYKFVSFTAGVELVLEAHERFWRKPPNIKRLVMRIISEEATRFAMLKRGEVDVAYSIRGELAEDVKRTAGLKLAATVVPSTFWVDFTTDQWNPKSPWHDKRVRLAASVAIDRQAISQAETLGFSKPSSSIIPSTYEYYWAAPAIPYDPALAKKLLAEAGYPQGFDAGELTCDSSYANVAEAVVNYFNAVGIKTRLKPMERAAWLSQWRDKKIKGLMQGAAAAFGNAATRIENYLTSRGSYVYGTYPEIEALFAKQAQELDQAKREALLHEIQRIAYDRVMFAPIWELAFLNGVGPRVEEAGLGLIQHHPYSSPYEDLKLRSK